MPNSDELIAIVERILNGSRDESEVAQLRQWLKVSGTMLQFVSQDGKFNTNIGQVQGGEIHIGDRHYQVDVEALRGLLQPTTPLPNIDWHAVSQAMLEEQLRLTTNPLTSGEGISYRTEQVYVPLGLVERKRQTRRREDVAPEQGSLLYEETEITQRFEHEQFLEQVLRQGQSPKSRGKRLAIIGEPGAGKTTLLQQIAQWVSEQVEGAISIWVSLADLRGQELEPYLLERWLQAVVRKLGQAEASPQVKDAFVAQFQPGRVWLLLDGVDEMQVSSGNPLAEISRQVRMGGLLSQARIVLTCRLNLWDGERNALDTFDTYRTLKFSYPQQVEQFIGQWFGALPEGQGVQAERLCAALKEPGKERIRDLVKNPLRLTLLCFNWYLGEGTLPETKAGLYEQFVADFYEWKREQFPTTAKQRRQLNTALGELAREAIDKEETRFRLRHDFVCAFLGEPDEEGSLFQLALQLGWLNQVGVDAENPRKAVYAFFHPTFQEYFAAKYFCEDAGYHSLLIHIGEKHWREIFLLATGIAPGGSELLQLIKTQTDKLLAEDQELQLFLSWIEEKLRNSHLCGDLALHIRTAYFTLVSAQDVDLTFLFFPKKYLLRTHTRAIMNWLNRYTKKNDLDVINYIEAAHHGLIIANEIDEIIGCNIILNLALHCITKTISYIYLYNLVDYIKDIISLLEFRNLEFTIKEIVIILKNEFLFLHHKDRKEWFNESGQYWIKQLKDLIVEHYNIGQQWNFNTNQRRLLEKYHYNNLLIIDCLKNKLLSKKEEKQIKVNLFSPIKKSS